MKKIFALLLLTLLNVAFSDPRADIVPVSLKFNKGLDDDVSMTYSQHVFIYVTNTGNVSYRVYDPIKVSLNGVVYTSYLYDSDEAGGGRGGPLSPGETGKLFLRLPLNTLRHCQKIDVKIDLDRLFQFGPSVFSNDQKLLTAMEFNNNRFCYIIRPPIHPLPISIKAAPMR